MTNRTHAVPSLLLALLLAACGSKADPKALMTEASKLEQAGNLNGALIQLKNAAQAHSDDKDVRMHLGQLYLTMEDYASAEKEFKRARQNGVDSSITDPLIAQALMGQHDYQRLVEEIPLPEKGLPSYADILAKRAQALIGLDRTGEAEKLLDQARADDLQSPDILLARASLALKDKKVDEALQALEGGLKLDPHHVDTLLFKASLLQAKGKSAEAEAIYKTVIGINPHHQGARLALARIAMGDSRLDEARKDVADVLKDSPRNVLAKYTLALIDFKDKKITEARDQLAPVLRSAPNYLPAVLLSGALEFNLGNMESAQNQLLKVLQADPNHVYARRTLAAAQLRLGQTDQAAETLAPLKPEASEDPGTLIIAGEIALAHRQFAQAENFFAKANRLDPKSAAIRTELGLARLNQGEAQGLADLESAAASDQGGQRAAALLIVAHLKRGEFDAALKAAAEMAQKQPQSPLPVYLTGVAYMGKKDEPNARKYFEQAIARSATYFPAAAALAQLDLKDGQAKAAQARFDAVLAADPKNIQAMEGQALLALKSGQENKFLEWLNKATQTDSKALKPRALIAQYYLSKRDFAKALAAARDAISAQPDDPAARELLGSTQLAAGEVNNAISTYGKLVEMKPDSAAIRLQQGRALMAAQQLDAAQASFEKALNIKPDFIEAQLALASLDAKAGRYNEGIKIARQIQTSQPGNITGLVLEGDIHMAAKQPADALSSYEKAATVRPSGGLIIKQQYALNALGRSAEGEGRLASWLKQHPEDLAVRAQYAGSLLSLAQYPSAVEQYRYLSAKLPNNLMVLNNMAYALAQMKDKNAVQVAQQALKLAPDNPATLDTMGWALLKSGQATKALPYLRQALSKQPDSGDIHYHLAAALAESGDKARARQELKQLMDSGLDFSQKPAAQALMQSL
ncbi:MAG: XrtA/PEP-CTERM system TPR-repeat protein PrsT [Thiobacillaceae bacterium]